MVAARKGLTDSRLRIILQSSASCVDTLTPDIPTTHQDGVANRTRDTSATPFAQRRV